jgi:hypothetical protein
MRRNHVEAVLGAASQLLFEDVVYTHAPAGPIIVPRAIAGVEIAAEQYDIGGQAAREVTHQTRALKAKFPDLARGDIIDDGAPYKVLDIEPVGDGRFEIRISLKKL